MNQEHNSPQSENELIAQFMGIHVRLWDKVLFYSDEDGYVDIAGDAQPYWPDKSWNQLMPVVEKIEMCGHFVLIEDNYCRISTELQFKATCMKKIDAVYKAVVQFIKFYNQQKP